MNQDSIGPTLAPPKPALEYTPSQEIRSDASRVHIIDPLVDSRWAQFLENHNLASVFHSGAWLDSLRQTYGFVPHVATLSKPGEPLRSGVVFCEVKSWLTGKRLVSAPFSDHCTPLLDSKEEYHYLTSALKRQVDRGAGKYLELRTTDETVLESQAVSGSPSFYLHKLDLRPRLDDLFHAFHGDCIRRKITRADREGVTYEEGRSEDLLLKFHQLTVATRRRHFLPPQPLAWFRNLITCLGKNLKLRLAFYRDQAVAGILTIRFKNTMTYKYGCSDANFHKFGCMQMLMWKTIQEAKADGLLALDMGRTDQNNEGLLTFKDRWGGTRSALRYLRYPNLQPEKSTTTVPMRMARKMIALAPDRFLVHAGRSLYGHFA